MAYLLPGTMKEKKNLIFSFSLQNPQLIDEKTEV